jgi:hypothetical protein
MLGGARGISLVSVCALALAACTSGDGGRDAVADAAGADVGLADVGAADLGLADVGAADLGFADVGPAEADAGVAPADDAGLAQDAAPTQDGGVLRVRRYAAIGSSSTQGAGASAPDRAYVPVLAARLGARFGEVALLNLGTGGGTIDGFLARADALRAHAPELVTVLPFTDYVRTDVARFRSGYDALFALLGGLGARVYFGALTVDPALVCGRASPPGCYAPEDARLLEAKNAVLAELAASHPHVVVVTVLDQNVAHPEWNAPDGHPNDLGHGYLADTFWAAIEPDLAPR